MHLRFRSQRPAAISYQQTYNVPPWNGALLRRRSSSSISSDYILPPQISSSLPLPPSLPPSFFFRHSSASCPWNISFSLPSFSLSPSLPWKGCLFSILRVLSFSHGINIITHPLTPLISRVCRIQKNFNRFSHRFYDSRIIWGNYAR